MRARGFRLAPLLLLPWLLAGSAAAQPDCFPEDKLQEIDDGMGGVTLETVTPARQICEGDVLVTDTILDQILIVERLAGTPPIDSTLADIPVSPRGLTVDSNGFLYVNEAGAAQVLRVDLQFGALGIGVVAPDPFDPNPPIQLLEDLDFAPDGRLFAADPSGEPGAVFGIDPVVGNLDIEVLDLRPIGPFDPRVPQGLAFDPDDGDILYMADADPNCLGTPPICGAAIWRVDLSANAVSPAPVIILDSGIDGGVNLLQKPYDIGVYDPTPGDPANQDDDVLLVTNTPLFAPPTGVAISTVRLFGIIDPGSTRAVAGIDSTDDIDDPSNEITAPSHGVATGDGPVRLRIETAGDDFPSPLTAATDYWIIEIDSDTIQLAASAADALAGTEIDISPAVGSFVLFELADSFPILDDLDLDRPKGIVMTDEDDDQVADHFYVADSGGDEVRKYTISGAGQSAGDVGFVQSFAGYNNPWGLAVVGDLNPVPRADFVVVDRSTDPMTTDSRLVRMSPKPLFEDIDGNTTNPISTASQETIFAGPDLIEPIDVCVDPGPTYTVSEAAPPDLLTVDGGGTTPFMTATGALDTPQRVVLDSDGNRLVADPGKLAILKVFADGSVATFLEHDPSEDCTTTACVLAPVGLDFDPDGILVVAQRNLTASQGTPINPGDVESLLRVVPVPGAPLVFPLPFQPVLLDDPRDMVLDANGDALVVDRSNLAVFSGGPGVLRVSSVTGRLQVKPGYGSFFFDQLSGIALDRNREILVVESGPGTPFDPMEPDFTRGVLRIEPTTGQVFAIVDQFDIDNVDTLIPFEEPDGIAIDEVAVLPPAFVDADRDGFGPTYDNCEPPQVDVSPGGQPFDLCNTGDGCFNPDQADTNANGFGDACERDDPDRDGLREFADNCPQYDENKVCPNATDPAFCSVCVPGSPLGEPGECTNPAVFGVQPDSNLDGIGDACQPFDPDKDGIGDDDDTDDMNPLPPFCDSNTTVDCIDNCTPTTQACTSSGCENLCQDSPADPVCVPGPLDLDCNNPCANSGQENSFGDGANVADDEGDACDDSDLNSSEVVIGDGIVDLLDNCPRDFNPNQEDFDGDGIGDVCDNDDDGDGVDEIVAGNDNCDPNETVAYQCVVVADCFNPGQQNQNFPDDLYGDVCQPDDEDGDGWPEANAPNLDNCSPIEPLHLCTGSGCSNISQADNDTNGLGDICDDIKDNDGVPDDPDNCDDVFNPNQNDANGNGIGDACDTSDSDGDTVLDLSDNCVPQPNTDQTDTDADGFGNRCDMDLVGGDNLIGVPDFVAFQGEFGSGTPDPEADATGDGVVGVPDFVIFAERFGTCAGDAAPFPGPCPLNAP